MSVQRQDRQSGPLDSAVSVFDAAADDHSVAVASRASLQASNAAGTAYWS